MTSFSFNKGLATEGQVSYSNYTNFDDIDNYYNKGINVSDEINNNIDEINLNEFLEMNEQEEINNSSPSFVETIGDAIISTGATFTVGITSALSGAVDTFESFADGLYWAGATITSWLGLEDASQYLKDIITVDMTDELNKSFYEDTKIGKAINNASIIKYDSDVAQGIRRVSKAVTTIAVATYATGGASLTNVATTGVKAIVPSLQVLGMGLASGIGTKAKEVYQKDTDTTISQELGIFVSGLGEAMNWYAQGQLGSVAKNFIKEFKRPIINSLKSINISTLKNTGANIVKGAKSIISKIKTSGITNPIKDLVSGSIKNSTFASLKAADNLVDSVGIIGDNLSDWLVGDEEFNLTNAVKAGGELLATWGLNMFFDGFGDYLRNEIISGNVKFDELNWNELDVQKSSSVELIKSDSLISTAEMPIINTNISLEIYNSIKDKLNKIDELKKNGFSMTSNEIKEILLEIGNCGLSMEEIKQIVPLHEQVNLGYVFIDDKMKRWFDNALYRFDNEIDAKNFANNLLNIDLLNDILFWGSLRSGNVLNQSTGTYLKFGNYCDLLNDMPDFQQKIYLTKILDSIKFEDGIAYTKLTELTPNHKKALINMVNGIDDNNVKSSLLNDLLTGKMTIENEFEYMSYYLQRGTTRYYDDCYTRIYDSIRESFSQGNHEVAYINMMCLASCGNDVEFSFEPGQAYVQGTKKLVLKKMVNSTGTTYHEFGHLLHHRLANKHIPSNIDSILANAQQNGATNIKDLIDFQKSNKSYMEILNNLGRQDFENNIIQQYGSIENKKQSILFYIKDLMNEENRSISEILSWNGVSEETIKCINDLNISDDILFDKVVDSIYNQELEAHCELFKRKGPGSAVSDMIAAIYKTDKIVINGQNIPLTFRHNDDYWKEYSHSFSELFANYNNLKMTGRTDVIEKMKGIFGKELFDQLENIYKIALYI